MATQQHKRVIIILGPTASGKTAVSIELARRLGTEIISCDSRQFYREIPIGTAAPTAQEQDGIPHHFIGTKSVVDEYSCGTFEQDALRLLEELFERLDTVIVTGGSGLYIDALCGGIDDIPSDQNIREELQSRYQTEGLAPLVEQLKMLDAEYCNTADLSNRQRVIRALEVCLATGRTYSSFRAGEGKKRDFEIVKIGLTMDRELLYDRINRRVDIMVEQGLEEEARGVFEYRANNALQTVGYKEFFDYFEDKCSREEAIDLIKRNSRRYAKRQMTWFRRDENIAWFTTNDQDVVKQIEKYLNKFAENDN